MIFLHSLWKDDPWDVDNPHDGNPPTKSTPATENNIHEKVETSDNVTHDNSNNTDNGTNKPHTDSSKLDSVPKTGDSSCINMWIFTALISFISFAVLIFTRKRRN